MEEQKPEFNEVNDVLNHLADAGLETSTTDAEASSEASVERMPDLAQLLHLSELKAAENHDAWLRAKAETENMRRRAQDDIARASKYAIEKFAEALDHEPVTRK